MAVLRIRMLGNLEMEYNGREVERDLTGNGKMLQLFLILSWAGARGISRGKLQDYLYDTRSANAGNALRVSISRLRKVIADAGLAGPDNIQYKNGNYVFQDPKLTLEVDAVMLEKACARRRRRAIPENGWSASRRRLATTGENSCRRCPGIPGWSPCGENIRTCTWTAFGRCAG